jgi:hypothetical protein
VVERTYQAAALRGGDGSTLIVFVAHIILYIRGGVSLTMVKLETYTRDTIDIRELGAFTFGVYQFQAQPYRYGNTEAEIESLLSDKRNCPDFLVVARGDGGAIQGWAGLYHWTDSMPYLLS